MKQPVGLKTLAILAISALAVCLGTLNLIDRASWKQVSDGVTWVKTSRGLEAGAVSGEDAPEGLKPGDLLLSVNDIPVGDLDDLTEIQSFLGASLPEGSSAVYRIQDSSGHSAEYRLPLKLKATLGAVDFLLALTAIGFLLIGLFIFVRNWKAVGAFHFYVISLVAFIAFLFRHSGRSDLLDLVIYWFNAVAFLLLPPLLVHFCLYFPRPLRRLQRAAWVKPLLYAPALLLGLLHAFWFAGWLLPFGLPRNPVAGLLIDQIELLHLTMALVVSSGLLWWKMRHANSTVQRQQMKWIALGSLAGAIPFVVFYGVPYVWGLPVNLLQESSVLTLLLIPLSFGYAITRYRLMDVDVIFKRSAAYLLATSGLMVVYVLIVLLAGKLMETRSGGAGLLPFAVGALVVAFLFAPLRNWIQEGIERHFYKDRYDYRKSFAEFGRTLSSETSLPELARKICHGLRQTLDVAPVGIFLRQSSTGSVYELHFQDGEATPQLATRIEISDGALRSLGGQPPVLMPNLASDEVDWGRRFLSELGFRYAQPLEARDRIIGFLAFGPRPDDQWLSSDDLQLVETIAGYAAIALDNAVLYQSLESHAAQLAELKVYNESVIESITLGVMALTPLGEIATWNHRMEAIFGMTAAEAVGRNITEVLPKDLLAVLRRFIEPPRWEVPEGGLIHKASVTNREGETRMLQIGFAPLLSTQHLNAGSLIVVDDITEKTQLENQLMQSEKLSSIGLFAAGVAHEVNTPLAGISSYSQMLLKEIPEDDPRREMLERIEQQSFRASEIVNNLLKFARVSEKDFQEINLNSLMLETVSLLDHPLKKSGVDVTLDLDPSLPATVGSGGKLQQVFMNLFLNARDAMPKGGEVRVRTFCRDSNLVVQVQDEGEGISADHVKRIYDPFFTTKEVGKGTGLGLAVSYGIIQEHSGRINVESEPGRGTIFTVELPLRRVH